MSLSASKVLGLFEIPQILMICYHYHWVFSSGEVVVPLLQGLDDHKEFSIIDVIVSFCQREDGRVICTGMEISVRIFLHKYSSRSSEGGIGHDKEGFGGVWHLDHRGRKEHFFKFDKGVVLFLSPMEGNPFLGQIMEWSGECGEVRDELLVEVAKSDEGSDCFYRLGGLPLFHGLQFGGIHEYFSICDYQSQVLHFCLIKGTLGQFEVEIFLLHPVEYLFSPFLTCFQGFGKHKDIIDVNDQPSFRDHVCESGVHEGLEGRWVLGMLDRHRRTPFFLLLGRAILTKRLTSFQ